MVAVQSPPIDWGPFQHYAFGLALQRYSRVLADQTRDIDLQAAAILSGNSRGFFDLMGRAEGAILNLQAKGNFGYEAAATMVLHEDLAAPEAAIEKDLKVLRDNGVL